MFFQKGVFMANPFSCSIRKTFLLVCLLVLPLEIIAAPPPAPTIKRDEFGVPTILGGNFAQVSQAIGQVMAEDRLWQVFLFTTLANGRAAQYFGPSYLDQDISARQINPTDSEVQYQIDTYFNENTLVAYQYFVDGLNNRVAQVNADPALIPYELRVLGFDPPSNPVPDFTLYDIIRTSKFILQEFSPSQIPTYQLNNLVALETLVATFGDQGALAIFNDIDPQTNQVKGTDTIVPNDNCGIFIPYNGKRVKKSTASETPKNALSSDPTFKAKAKTAAIVAERLKNIKKLRKKFVPALGSNGQSISPCKSASGNALLRGAPQPNFNHPSDFYEVRVVNDFLVADFFPLAGMPYGGVGIYNNYGLTVQVGHLPTNDFTFEPVTNIISTREEVFFVAGDPNPVIVPISRSSSGGWVIESSVVDEPGIMLTLRSSQFDKQLRGLNLIAALPFFNSIHDLFHKGLKIKNTSDLLGLEGQCADCQGNIGAFQATAWTRLPPGYDRRIPQGLPTNPAATNDVYFSHRVVRKPLKDKNTKQGYYTGWNTLFKQGAQGSEDTVLAGFPLSRGYWLLDFLKKLNKISFEDLKQLTVRQAVANSILGFDNVLNEDADLFTPLFKSRFFQAVRNQESPTTAQLKALNFLDNYEGRWFEGGEAQIITTPNVSDKFILASAWLLNFSAMVLNPILGGTYFEVNPGSAGVVNALPNTNAFDNDNDQRLQANLLSRILGTACDNTVYFPDWLAEFPNVDDVIVAALDQALTNLGGFGARPWGAGLRGHYSFENAVLGPVLPPTKVFNASGLYLIAEFGPNGIVRKEAVIPLGESGEVLGYPGVPVFSPNNFDQYPLWDTFQLRVLQY